MRIDDNGHWLFTIAGVAFAAVGAALYSQHVLDMQPCPWCVLQRVEFLALGLVALAAGFMSGAARRIGLGLVALLALLGAGTAVYQHFVAASSASCNLSLADRIIGELGLDAAFPQVFMATANCGDNKVSLIGMPYEFWSFSLFAAMAGLAMWLFTGHRGPRL